MHLITIKINKFHYFILYNCHCLLSFELSILYHSNLVSFTQLHLYHVNKIFEVCAFSSFLMTSVFHFSNLSIQISLIIQIFLVLLINEAILVVTWMPVVIINKNIQKTSVKFVTFNGLLQMLPLICKNFNAFSINPRLI